MTPEQIARVCHEANRAYCETIGDTSQVEWDDGPRWARIHAISDVRVTMADPGATPESMHVNWSADKLRAGWAYGPVWDAEARTHPCLVPYAELPAEQRAKDALFFAVVRALSGESGQSLFLWLVRRDSSAGWDEYDAILCACRDEVEARSITVDKLPVAESTVSRLGAAGPGIEPGILMWDFNNG